MTVAEGSILGDAVAVPAGRDASALHSKGSHGTPKSGGGLELSLVEAAYLVECGRLHVRGERGPLALEALLSRGAGGDDRFEIRYLVYRDFRERGFVVREEPASARIDFSVRPRGTTAKSPSSLWVLAVSERGEFRASEMASFAQRASALGKEAHVAVVDEEGDITYYAFEPGLEGGKGPRHADTKAHGTLSGNHVLVAGEAAALLHSEEEMLGKPLKHLLRLSLLEAVYLAQGGRLAVTSGHENPRAVTGAELLEHASKVQRDFPLRLSAYRALRHAGLVPKTGFKYGAHFRVYDREGESTHARYLVHAVPEDFACPWPELSRAVRLSHGVRKRLVYALAGASPGVRFLKVRWTRP